MEGISFILKNPEDCEEWLQNAPHKFSSRDLNYIATLAWNLSHLEDFVFGDENRSKEFFKYMQETDRYGSELH
jgi:hypothetical protein